MIYYENMLIDRFFKITLSAKTRTMKEHLLAIVFLGLLFLLYLAPLPDSFLNKSIEIEDYNQVKKERIETEHNANILNTTNQDSIRTSVAEATNYKIL